MADTLALRRRIKTAQNISKTTRAMQMIAASKLKKAQAAVVASRPFVEKLSEVTLRLTPQDNSSQDSHPYLQERKGDKALYVFIGPDKGLCGGLNTNLIREYLKVRHDSNAVFVTIGKKIQGPVASAGKNLLASFHFGTKLPTFEQVLPIIDIINEQYLSGHVDKVKLISTHFNTVFSQTPVVTDLLPVKLKEPNGTKEPNAAEFMFEPSKETLLPNLLHRYIEMVVFQQFLENYASYNAAQMIAMQNATNNAKDIVNDLQLLYNKARQEKITKEILDISSAAVALANA